MADPFSATQEHCIERLPSATRNKLRSTQILTSLSQLVSELLQNSLDAGALQVDIGVDCEEWSCWIQDDGVGISKNGMNLLGTGSEDGRYGEGIRTQETCVPVSPSISYLKSLFDKLVGCHFDLWFSW